MLYLVATPIGNLGDVSARALETLRTASVIAAEDTRVTRKLLAHFDIHTPMVAYHEHSGPAATAALVRRMADAGESVALVTDAGTPGISDPGIDLVAAAVAAGIAVVPVPGAAAFVAALTASGLPCARFAFEGFLPRTRGSRVRRLKALSAETRTVIFYEAPQRVGETLGEIAEAFGGERPACVARELTKRFEEFQRGPVAELAARYAAAAPRGECVLVVAGAGEPAAGGELAGELAAEIGAASAPADEAEEAVPAPAGAARGKELIRQLAAELGVPRRELYQMVLRIKNAGDGDAGDAGHA